MLLEAISREMNAEDEKRDRILFSGCSRADDIASPVTRSLQLMK
jgi:hypothetical protein